MVRDQTLRRREVGDDRDPVKRVLEAPRKVSGAWTTSSAQRASGGRPGHCARSGRVGRRR